jgi:hypothetical protein
LPHYTTPFSELENVSSVAAVSDLLAEHYTKNWDVTKARFLVELETYAVDEDAKSCFREALLCHEARLYRPCVRTLFPEIERVVRDEILEGRLDGIAGLKEFRDAVSFLPAYEITSRSTTSMALYKRLQRHLYAKADQPTLLHALEKEAVPNRHAALHGLLPYKAQQNSINALIMTDFAFMLVSVLIDAKHDDAAGFKEFLQESRRIGTIRSKSERSEKSAA